MLPQLVATCAPINGKPGYVSITISDVQSPTNTDAELVVHTNSRTCALAILSCFSKKLPFDDIDGAVAQICNTLQSEE